MGYDRLKSMLGKKSFQNRPPLAVQQQNWQGVNYVDEPAALQASQVPYAKNVDFGNPIGAATKRDGVENLFDSLGAGEILGLHGWKHSTGDIILAAHGTKLYKLGTSANILAKTSTADFNAGVLANLNSASDQLQLKAAPVATFARSTVKYKADGSEIAIDTASYETGKFNNGVHINEAATNLIADFPAGWTAGTGLTAADQGPQTGAAGNTVRLTNADLAERYYTSPKFALTASTTYTVRFKARGTVGAGGFDIFVLSITGTLIQRIAFPVLTASFQVFAYTFTTSADITGTEQYIRFDHNGNDAGYIEIAEVAVVQKAYDAGFPGYGGTRSADSLYYTPAVAIPNEWLLSGFWIPDQPSTIDRANSIMLATLYYDNNNVVYLRYDPASDRITLVKSHAGTLVALESSVITFAAGDIIAFGAAQTTQAYGDLAAGMHLWYRIGSNSVVHISGTDVNLPTAPTRVYVGCYSGTGYEANGVIDALKLVDLAAQSLLGTTINNSWAEALLTTAIAPIASTATILLANFNNATTATRSANGLWYSPTYDLAKTPETAILEWTTTVPAGTTVLFYARGSADGVTWGSWQLIPLSGDNLPRYRYLQIKIATTGDTPTVSDFTVTYTSFESTPTEITINTVSGRTAMTGGKVYFADYSPDDHCVVVDGGRPLILYVDSGTVTARDAGVDPPTTAPTIAAGAGAGLTGDYYAKVTFVNEDGVEGNPSPATTKLTLANKNIAWSAIPVGPTGTAKRKLYRTAAGGSVYKFVTEIADNTTTTYTDDVADASLGDLMNDNNNVPPNADLVYEYMNYMFYVANAAKTQLWYSKVGIPEVVPNISGDRYYKEFAYPVSGVNSAISALVVGGENFASSMVSNTGLILDSDPTIDTSVIKTVDKGGPVSQAGMALCTDTELRTVLLFPTKTGIRFLMPGYQEQSLEAVPLSRNAQPYFDRAVNREDMAAVFFDNRYIISFAHQVVGDVPVTANNVTFIYDFRSKQWYGPWMVGVSRFAVAETELYAGDATVGKVYRMFSGATDDAGEDIEFILDLPRVSPQGEHFKYRVRRFLVVVSADSVTTDTVVKVKVDDREAAIPLNALSSTFTGDERPGHNTIRSRKYPIPLPPGYTFSVRIVDDSSNPLSVQKCTVEYEQLQTRR